MERTVSATHARIRFGELLREVAENRGTFIVERGGRPAAAVVPLAMYERLRGGDIRRRDPLDEARELRQQILARRGDRPLPASEEMIREARELRDADLDRLR